MLETGKEALQLPGPEEGAAARPKAAEIQAIQLVKGFHLQKRDRSDQSEPEQTRPELCRYTIGQHGATRTVRTRPQG